MASNNRQAEETRIRRALEINSFDLTTLEHHLMERGYIPDSSDEQAARDAALRFRKDYNVNTFPPCWFQPTQRPLRSQRRHF